MQAQKSNIVALERLKKRAEFLRVQKAGGKWVARGMIVQAAANKNLGRRYGLTVSRRVSKSAVIRNRIRRRLRAAACDILPVHACDNADFVLIGRLDTEKRLYEDLKKDLIWCLKKLHMHKTQIKKDSK